MKNNKEMMRGFALHLLKEHGYTGEWNEEDIKKFISEKFDVKWVEPKYGMKYGATFKPDNSKVHEYGVYSSSFEAVAEKVIWEIHKGYWKKEN